VLKRSKWAFLLLLATAVTFVSVMPMADQPETAFNEIDTPVNQTTPVAPWVKFVPPVGVRFILSRSFDHTGEGIRTSVESVSLAPHWHVSPLRENPLYIPDLRDTEFPGKRSRKAAAFVRTGDAVSRLIQLDRVSGCLQLASGTRSNEGGGFSDLHCETPDRAALAFSGGGGEGR
jgi:hypothetical protein